MGSARAEDALGDRVTAMPADRAKAHDPGEWCLTAVSEDHEKRMDRLVAKRRAKARTVGKRMKDGISTKSP